MYPVRWWEVDGRRSNQLTRGLHPLLGIQELFHMQHFSGSSKDQDHSQRQYHSLLHIHQAEPGVPIPGFEVEGALQLGEDELSVILLELAFE